MKKTLILSLLALSGTVASTFGQGAIKLDNYNTSGPIITYGQTGIPANGVSGTSGTVGAGLGAGWTFGLYEVVGNVTGSVAADPSHTADPSSLGGGLTVGTGSGSTGPFFTSSFNTAGEAKASSSFIVPGTAQGGGDTITVMLVAYNGADYLSSGFRGHSSAFTMTTSAGNSPSPVLTGSAGGFSVFAVPEPSVFALASLGGAFLMLIRRKK